MVSRSKIKQLITYYYKSGEVVDNRTGRAITDHRMKIDGVTHPVRRLIWLYMTGEWYTGNIYLIEGDSTEWVNLTNTRPERERRVNAKNESGVKGITYSKRDDRWSVSIYRDGHQHYIGSYKDMGEAVTAHREALKEMGMPEPDPLPELPPEPELPKSGCEGVDWNLEYQRWFVTDADGEYLGSSKRLDWACTKRKQHDAQMFL